MVESSAWLRPFEVFVWAMKAVCLFLLTDC